MPTDAVPDTSPGTETAGVLRGDELLAVGEQLVSAMLALAERLPSTYKIGAYIPGSEAFEDIDLLPSDDEEDDEEDGTL